MSKMASCGGHKRRSAYPHLLCMAWDYLSIPGKLFHCSAHFIVTNTHFSNLNWRQMWFQSRPNLFFLMCAANSLSNQPTLFCLLASGASLVLSKTVMWRLPSDKIRLRRRLTMLRAGIPSMYCRIIESLLNLCTDLPQISAHSAMWPNWCSNCPMIFTGTGNQQTHLPMSYPTNLGVPIPIPVTTHTHRWRVWVLAGMGTGSPGVTLGVTCAHP